MLIRQLFLLTLPSRFQSAAGPASGGNDSPLTTGPRCRCRWFQSAAGPASGGNLLVQPECIGDGFNPPPDPRPAETGNVIERAGRTARIAAVSIRRRTRVRRKRRPKRHDGHAGKVGFNPPPDPRPAETSRRPRFSSLLEFHPRRRNSASGGNANHQGDDGGIEFVSIRRRTRVRRKLPSSAIRRDRPSLKLILVSTPPPDPRPAETATLVHRSAIRARELGGFNPCRGPASGGNANRIHQGIVLARMHHSVFQSAAGPASGGNRMLRGRRQRNSRGA